MLTDLELRDFRDEVCGVYSRDRQDNIRVRWLLTMDAVTDKYVTHEVLGGVIRTTAKGDHRQASNTQTKNVGRHRTSSAPT